MTSRGLSPWGPVGKEVGIICLGLVMAHSTSVLVGAVSLLVALCLGSETPHHHGGSSSPQSHTPVTPVLLGLGLCRQSHTQGPKDAPILGRRVSQLLPAWNVGCCFAG